MKYYRRFLLLICYFCINTMLYSQESVGDNEGKTKTELKLDFPVFDFPYQADTMNARGYGFFNTYSSLSMGQSMAVAMDVYSSMHYGLMKLNDSLDIGPVWRNIIYYGGTAAGILAFAYVLPFGCSWMQYEHTRSVLSRFGVSSRNGLYNFTENYWVYGITDDELSHFKATAPYDFIRMNVAGMEGYNLFSDLMARKYFFYDLNDLSFVTAFTAAFFNLGSVGAAFIQEYGNLYGNLLNTYPDKNIEEWYKNDKGQTKRYITGYDAVNWVYELFRPDELYADRGQHPSGDGSVARYITLAQLTDDERKYLVRQGWLSYLNFASPLLYGFKTIPLGGFDGNVALRHYQTSFGTDTSVNVFLKQKPFNMAFALHNYLNYNNWFPALEAELIEYPFTFGAFEMLLSPRVLIGMQPKDQVFKTSSPEFMGLFGLRVDYMAHRNIFPYLDFTVKTNGWVAGNEYLDSNASVKLGVSLRF